MQKHFEFNYAYLIVAVLSGLAGSLTVLIGLVYFIANVAGTFGGRLP